MRKLFIILRCAITFSAFAQPADKVLSKAELLETPEKLGSIYYAYPGPQQEILSDAPKGYTAFYISHYGRHGSRFQPSDERYKFALDLFEDSYQMNNLTPLGEDVMNRIHRLWVIARGNGGLPRWANVSIKKLLHVCSLDFQKSLQQANISMHDQVL